MSYELNYEFETNDGDIEQFYFEIDEEEAADYITRTFDIDDILYDFTAEVYPYMSNKEKENLKVFDYDGTADSIYYMDDEAKYDMLNEVIYDIIDRGVYDAELRDYFEDEAGEMFSYK